MGVSRWRSETIWNWRGKSDIFIAGSTLKVAMMKEVDGGVYERHYLRLEYAQIGV